MAPVRKSQVQHALCEVLAAMLADNVKADMPRYAPCAFVSAAAAPKPFHALKHITDPGFDVTK